MAADGDSITAGSGTAAPSQTYPAVARDSLVAGTAYSNTAVSGQTCAQIAARYSTSVAPFYASNRARNVASIMCGANDGGGTAAASYASILSWVSAAKASGYQVIVLTMLSRVGGDTFKNALNPLITGGAVANGYTVADAGSDPNLGCDGCYTNSTYFQADGIHPTVVGEALVATGYYEPALASLGFN